MLADYAECGAARLHSRMYMDHLWERMHSRDDVPNERLPSTVPPNRE